MQSVIRGLLMSFGRGKSVVQSNNAANKTGPVGPAEKQSGGKSCFNMDKCFEVGYESVRLATAKLMKAIQTERIYKSATSRLDLFTTWDTMIEDMLVNNITQHYPDHKFITEDKVNFETRSAVTLTNQPTWFIDPIDGTMNFVHGFPYAAVSLAFWLNKQPEFGIIWNPLLDQCYTSRRGLGSYMNVNPLQVSTRCELSEALLMHELGTDLTFRSQKLENVDRATRVAHAMRSLGSTPLNMCMVAQGYADAYYEFGCHAWDVAAAMLVVQEAGGVVLDPSLKPFDLMSRRVLCASTKELAQELSSVLIQLSPKPRDDETKKSKNEQSTVQCSSKKKADKKDNKDKKTKKQRHKPSPACDKYSDSPKKSCTRKKTDTTHSDPTLPGQENNTN